MSQLSLAQMLLVSDFSPKEGFRCLAGRQQGELGTLRWTSGQEQELPLSPQAGAETSRLDSGSDRRPAWADCLGGHEWEQCPEALPWWGDSVLVRLLQRNNTNRSRRWEYRDIYYEDLVHETVEAWKPQDLPFASCRPWISQGCNSVGGQRPEN